MGTTRLFLRSVLTLGLVAVVSSYGWAAERTSVTTGETVLKRATRIMSARIVSPQGETLGRVHDIVLTPDLNGVSYLAVSRGGILGMGGTLHAIPWSAVSLGLNDTYVAPITVGQLKQSRGFHPANWPSSAEGVWPAASVDRGETPAYSARSAAYNEDVKQRRFTRIKGSDVKGADGKKIGDVYDLAIAMDSGRIAYTIVSTGGFAGLGLKYAAVPQNAITLEPAMHVAHVNTDKATLQAHAFTSSRWPDLASPSYAQQLARAYNVEPSGIVLGYVPPAEAVAAAPKPKTPKPSARATTPSESTTTPAESTAAEPAPNELTGMFNPATITTIDGTVLNVGKFKPTATGQDMLWLRVRTTDGRTVLVNLGPRSYISTQDFYIVRGDQIHLTGSEVATTAAGRRVFLPTQVTYNSHVLRLRSETGTPLWEGQTTALGYTPPEEPGMTSFAPAGLMALGDFDASKSRTIDGTVTQVGKSQSPGGPEVVWLRVRTTDGQIVNVQVGPRDYVSQQGFFVVNGDRIHLTGWDARATGAPGAMPVFVVSDISQDGHTLRLRNSSGEPLWTSQTGIGAMPGTRSGMATEPNEPNKP